MQYYTPTKRRNVKSDAADAHERSKDYLDPHEVERLLDATREGRHGVRDHALLFMIYRHGLRVSEAITMRLDALNLKQARLTVNRSKNSLSTEQPIEGDELRAIKRYLNTREDKLPWLFVSERGQPMTRKPGEQGRRFSSYPGLPWASRPAAHCALHEDRQPEV